MAAYYVIVIVALLISVFDFIKNDIVRLVAYIGYCLALVLFIGLRSVGVDNDGANYADAFNLAAELPWSELIRGTYGETMERGYLMINKLISIIGGDIRAVFLLMAAATGAVNYTLIYKKSPLPFTSLFLYVCFFFFYRDFTQIRFALSAGIGMWAVFGWLDRKYLRAVVLVLLAASIHSAVLVILLLFVLYELGMNMWVYFALPLLGLVGGFFNPIMLLFRLGGLPPTLAQYVELDEFGSGGYVISAIAQVLMAAMLVFRAKLVERYSEAWFNLWFVALSVGSFINLLFISFAIMQRLALLLFGAVLFALPSLSHTLESEEEEKFYALFFRVVLMVYVLYYGLKMINPGLMQPYSIL